MARMRRRYGFPFKRYVSSRARHLIPPDAIAKDSLDWRLDPNAGSFVARAGSTALPYGGVNNLAELGGHLVAHDLAVVLGSATDNYPIHVGLVQTSVQSSEDATLVYWDTNPWNVALCSLTGAASNEVTTATANGFEDVTLGTKLTHANFTGGFAYVITLTSTTNVKVDRNASGAAGPATFTFTGAHRTVGQTGADPDHYPNYFKCVPLFRNNAYHRMQTAAERLISASGSRRLIEVGGRLLVPSQQGMPWGWNKRYNIQKSAGTTVERVMPWGAIMPLAPAVITQGALANDGTWEQDDSFYHTVTFVDEQGGESMPFVPRRKSTLAPAGLGLYTVTGAVGSKFDILTLSAIPIGPAGTRKRRLWRTPKNKSIDKLVIDDLQLWEEIPNNTVTVITSAKGNDNELVADPVNLHFDHLWCPPARYAWSADQRIFVGYINTTPAALVLAPREYLDNNDETLGATTYTAEVTGTDLVLRKGASSTTIALAGNTLEDLGDRVNDTTDSGSNGGEWVAQVVPGADRTQPAANLRTTSTIDFGDGTAARMRCYSNAWPGILYVSGGTIANELPEQRRRFAFTRGGPGHAAHAANNFHADNFRTAPETAGNLQGGGALLDGSIVLFERAVGLFRNIRDGKSGIDDDYRLEFLNEARGCCAPNSIAQGDGWVGYMTLEGYYVTDGRTEVCLSGDLWNPATAQGDFAAEFARAATQLGIVGWSDAFPARVMGGRLYLHLLSSDRTLVYDFSGGIGGSGLAEVLQPDGTPWGWSTPLNWPANLLCRAQRSTGNVLIGLKELVSGAGMHWLQIDTGHYDASLTLTAALTVTTILGSPNLTATVGSFASVAVGAVISGTNIPRNTTILTKIPSFAIMSADATGAGSTVATVVGVEIEPVGYTGREVIGGSKKISAQRAVAFYRKDAPGLALTHSRDQARASQRSLTLAAGAAGDGFTRKSLGLPIAARTNAEVAEWGFTDDGTFSTDRPEIFGIEAEIDVLEQSTR